ncbi:MAG: DUF4258 domain-containing protein [Candidatus Kariarchaeaceae archaeon]|jgi:hypothetical protein
MTVNANMDIYHEISEKTQNEDIFISNHAKIRMIQRSISSMDIKSLILNSEVIEHYPEDTPCPSALLLAEMDDIPYHLVIGNCEDHIKLITVYSPNKDEWIDNRIRKGDVN